MADDTISSSQIGSYDNALTASTVSTVTFSSGSPSAIEVGSQGGGSGVFFTTDGTTPTVAGKGCYYIPPSGGVRVLRKADGRNIGNAVKLISVGTPTVWVAEAT